MNIEEKLSKENKENYELYLKRMTESMKQSTKGLVPFFARFSKCVLDVGCGSGVMLQALLDNGIEKVIGIDINREAIKKLRKLNNKRIELYATGFEDCERLDIHPDAIIFSSVLHEISSYAKTDQQYTLDPIKDALSKAYNLLDKGGQIIIRDCLMVPYEERNKKIIIKFTNPEDANWLYRFKEEFKGFKPFDIDMNIQRINRGYKISYAFLKEFLYTYTWGPESWNREINERVGIIDSNTWQELVKEAGFELETFLLTQEDYQKYLDPKIKIEWANGKKFIYPYMNMIIVGKK